MPAAICHSYNVFRNSLSLRIVVLALLVAAASLSAAKPPFLKVFLATYKIKEDSKIGKLRCLNCHMPPAPPMRNPYGKAIQEALFAAHSRMVTPEILKSVEPKNMGDGLAYIEKIKKDIPPAEAKPKPTKAKPKPTAKLPKGKSTKGNPPKKHAMLFPERSAGTTALVLLCLAPIAVFVRRK